MFLCICWCEKKNSCVFNMENLGEDSPKKLVFNIPHSCHCCNKTVLVKNHPVDIFGEKSIKESELLNVLQFWTGKEIMMLLAEKTLPTMLQEGEEYYRIPHFVTGNTFCTGIVDWRDSYDASSWLATGWRITFFESTGEKIESVQSVRMCLFLEGDQHHDKYPPQLRPITPAPWRLPEFLQPDKERHDSSVRESCRPVYLSGLRKYKVRELLLTSDLWFFYQTYNELVCNSIITFLFYQKAQCRKGGENRLCWC